jgi:hypothetical protein
MNAKPEKKKDSPPAKVQKEKKKDREKDLLQLAVIRTYLY